MITAEGCRARQTRLWNVLNPRPDCVVLTIPRHITWLTGYSPNRFSFASQNAESILILEADARATLVLDNIQRRLADSAHVDEIVDVKWYDGRHSSTARVPSVIAAANEIISRRNPRSLGVDCGIPAALSESRHILLVDETLLQLSRSKDPDEMEVMRRSMTAMEAGYAAARAGIRPGMSELQAFTLVQRASTESAGHPAQIYGDFASGPRTEFGGGAPTERVIQPGDLFLLDYSVIINGYRGDLCSTWIVDGQPTPRQKEMEDTCLKALAAGEALLKPGVPCREVDSAVRGVFREHSLADHFRHHAGHGVGLGHPDPPYIVPESAESLAAGDLITLEPGCYIPGIGGMRFEHNYLITESGYERLSNHKLGLE